MILTDNTEILGWRSVPLHPPKLSHGLARRLNPAFSCEKPRTNIYITQAFNVHLNFFGFCIFCFCFVCMPVTSVRPRSPSWDTPNLQVNITVDDRSMVHDRAKTYCLGCTYNIHKFMHLQGESRELQRIGYIGLWRFSSYV